MKKPIPEGLDILVNGVHVNLQLVTLGGHVVALLAHEAPTVVVRQVQTEVGLGRGGKLALVAFELPAGWQFKSEINVI